MSDPAHTTAHSPREPAAVDVNERGSDKSGAPISMNRRLFMQLLGFECDEPGKLIPELGKALRDHNVPSVIYEDVNHPRGLALLTFSEDPADFTTRVRPILGSGVLANLRPRPELSMLGRTYSTGFEQDLEFWLLSRPRETVLNEAWPWAIWYPLRRVGPFERLDPRERGQIMREHGGIGKQYGMQDLAHDVRLACHGLDQADNDFVIGLIGKELHPLSHVVQAMRQTRQTAEFMDKMGPFFVGRAVFRNAG
ncbi:MAG TPA: chlorite dismutase family protein [Polyangiaceae bacterium]|nr:chlorite dismutase family protein [Polyangiaceae bacterium]